MKQLITLLFLSVVWTGTGCRSIPRLPPADLSSPDWRVRQGQAVWKPARSRPELAGEILFATNSAGDFFVSFSKPPFSLATAQIRGGQWQMEFGDDKHSWRGRVEPPARFVWFQLPRAFANAGAHGGWQFTRNGSSWRFENSRTGETLEGGFLP